MSNVYDNREMKNAPVVANALFCRSIVYSMPFFLALFATILSFSQSTIGENSISEQAEGEVSRSIIFGSIYIYALILFLSRGRELLSRIKHDKLYLIFVIYVLLSVFWSAYPYKVLITWGHYVGFYLICSVAMVSFEHNRKLFLWLLVTFSTISIIASLIAVFQYPSRGIMNFEGKMRWVGLTYSPNNLGELALVSIWACSALFCYERNILLRGYFVSLGALSMLCLIGANSITSIILGCLTVLAVPLFIYVRFDEWLLLSISFCFAALGLLIYVLLPDIFNADIVFSALGRESTLTGRTDIWATGINAFHDKPVFGWGFDVLMSMKLSYRMQYNQLHNGYLNLLVSGGIVGILLISLLLLSTMRNLIGLKISDPKFFGVLSALFLLILVHNFTEASLGRSPHILWLMLSILYFYAKSRLGQLTRSNGYV